MPGWYRFQVNGSNAIVPTFCPNVTRCGTQAPVWIRLNDPMPSAGQEVVGEACAAWIFPSTSTAVCCILKSPAKIRNCGTYLIYHIRGLTGCNLAFCALPAETRAAPKLAGTRPLPRLIIRPSLRGGASWLTCSASAVPGMLYNVSWYKHPARYKRVLLKDLRELDHPTDALLVSSVILGTEVSCQITGYFRNSSSRSKRKSSSERYFVGIKASTPCRVQSLRSLNLSLYREGQ
ncbi:hypothetical protein ISCGN_001299 [Ixodes scapularis]